MRTPVCHALLSALLFSYTAARCQNGGYKAEKGCICPHSFYGPLCEFIVDTIPPVKSIESSVKVKLSITNWKFTTSLTDPQTEDFKKFEANFKNEMKTFYYKVPGYTDIKILSVMLDSFTVEHEVFVKIQFRGNRPVTQRYHEVVQQVKLTLVALKRQSCTRKGDTSSLCVGDSITVTQIQPPSEHDFCRLIVPNGFNNFYSAHFNSEGLNCVSHCHQKSPNYLNCTEGRCQLSKTGPQCSCPGSHWYIKSDCSLRISWHSLYGTAIITISLLIVVFLYILRRMKNKVVHSYMKLV